MEEIAERLVSMGLDGSLGTCTEDEWRLGGLWPFVIAGIGAFPEKTVDRLLLWILSASHDMQKVPLAFRNPEKNALSGA